ncbi:MAG: AMP-binding protein [Syntrophobacterales bacterium]|nr:AMP-binding protein [Syntrophobacterales bacterium]
MGKEYLNQAICSHYVELKADEQPDREILIFLSGNVEERLTYGTIHENANKAARLLLDAGIGKGDKYIVLMHNHPEFVYALLAGPTIGAMMIPIDPRSTGKRLEYYFLNSGAKGVIVSDACLPQLEEILPNIQKLNLISVVSRPESGISPTSSHSIFNEAIGNNSWKRVEQQIFDVRQPMQIIYTSGTTGDPKGVMIRNNRTGVYNIMTRLVWKYSRDRDTLYTGLSLTHGNAQAVTLFPALYLGVKAVFTSRFTKSRIWDICRKYNCTSFSLLGGMLAGIFMEPQKPDDLDNPVNTVISAGTPGVLWEPFEKRFGVKVLEWYGAVEGGFAYKPVGKGPVGSFGKPVPGVMEMKVVDENDNEVPPDEKGELICRNINGDTRVDYWNMPAESEEKTRGGWLRTGDMVHKDKEGWLHFDYRKGAELRRSGDFIQPEYIERIIGEHPDISDVCVYGIPAASGAPGESDLVAAITPFAGTQIDPRSVFAKCRKELPVNFIPSWLQVVAEIPKTVSEKNLDRKLREDFTYKNGAIYRYDDFI